MIYELRIYDTLPGKLPALNDRFGNITMAFFKKHDIQVVGFWTDDVGVTNRLTYIVAYKDMAHRDQTRAAFAADPERVAAFAETEKNGPLVARIQNTILRPTSYSPMQ